MLKINTVLLMLMLSACSFDGWNPYNGAMRAAPGEPTSTPAPTRTAAPRPRSSPAPSETLEPSTWCTVSAQVLHLRSCGSVNCTVLDWLTQGEQLEIITLGTWHQVRTASGSSGWIRSEYCKIGDKKP